MNNFEMKTGGTMRSIALNLIVILAISSSLPAVAQRNTPDRKETTIKCGSTQMKVTLADLKKMAGAVKAYVLEHNYPNVPQELKTITEMSINQERPFIETNGTAHAGQFTVSGLPDGGVLLTLPIQSALNLHFTSKLQKTADGWKATSFDSKKVKPAG